MNCTVERVNEIWREEIMPSITGIFAGKTIVNELRARKKDKEKWDDFFNGILPIIDNNKKWQNRKIVVAVKTHICSKCNRVCARDEIKKFRNYENANGNGIKWSKMPVCKKCAGE